MMKTNRSVSCAYLRCVSRAATPRLGLSRIKLSVSEFGCFFPFCAKTHVIADFTFGKGDWKLASDGLYENVTEKKLINIDRLKSLPDYLPVKLKVWKERRKDKKVLFDSLGDLLKELESLPARLKLEVISDSSSTLPCSTKLQEDSQANTVCVSSSLSFVAEEGSVPVKLAPPPVKNGDARDQCMPMEGWVPSPEKQPESEDEDLCQGNFVTFINNFTGMVLRLPAHDESKAADRWRGPGAWTSDDDLLDDEALQIISRISSKPYVEKQRKAKWWKGLQKVQNSTP